MTRQIGSAQPTTNDSTLHIWTPHFQPTDKTTRHDTELPTTNDMPRLVSTLPHRRHISIAQLYTNDQTPPHCLSTVKTAQMTCHDFPCRFSTTYQVFPCHFSTTSQVVTSRYMPINTTWQDSTVPLRTNDGTGQYQSLPPNTKRPCKSIFYLAPNTLPD